MERVEGNLLIEFGFERHRECEIDPQSTCYRLDCDELHVCLWGFGMFFGRRDLGGLFVNRFDFRPGWAPIESLAEGIHWPDSPVIEAEMEKIWDPEVGDCRQELVFIGINMNETAIDEALEKCLLTDSEVAEGIEAWMKLDDPFPAWNLTIEEALAANS